MVVHFATVKQRNRAAVWFMVLDTMDPALELVEARLDLLESVLATLISQQLADYS
jgi:hypothetical protein